MWWYNILGDNKVRISHLLWIDAMTTGSILITTNLVALKRKNYDPVLIVKITEWRKFIDYYGLIIEADPSRVVKKNVYIFCIGYIPIPSSLNPYISRKHMEKEFGL